MLVRYRLGGFVGVLNLFTCRLDKVLVIIRNYFRIHFNKIM